MCSAFAAHVFSDSGRFGHGPSGCWRVAGLRAVRQGVLWVGVNRDEQAVGPGGDGGPAHGGDHVGVAGALGGVDDDGQVAEPLDVDAMRQAAVSLVGQHDFVAFTQPSLAGRQSTCRRMTRAEVKRSGRRIRVDMEANAFLPHQVRRTVGSLVEVGGGRLSPAALAARVREARPGAASFAAPARGLCLMKVRYEDGLFDDETDEDL